MATRKVILTAGIGLLLTSVHVSAQTTDSTQKNTSFPARVSVVPGLSTQGKADVRTTCNFSFNIFGGVTGGVNGVEIGGLFNIDKMNVQYVQVAGLFNSVGGNVTGVQVGGLYNTAKGNLKGIQIGGLTNYVQKEVEGIQVSGIHNHAGQKLYGIQVAGISNYTRNNLKGIQVAGISNISSKGTAGLQISGIFNYAKHLKGLQIGLINVADSSSGFSLGLVNITKKGFHKVALYSNEVLNMNIAYKSGNPKLYNILLAGINAGSNDKAFAYGYGLGHEIMLGKRVTINPELTTQYVYLGNWHYFNMLGRLQVIATIKLGNNIALFGGPAFSAYYTDQVDAVHGYKSRLPSNGYHAYELWNRNTTGWIGWTAGISFF
jgi:hypothetical protein